MKSLKQILGGDLRQYTMVGALIAPGMATLTMLEPHPGKCPDAAMSWAVRAVLSGHACDTEKCTQCRVCGDSPPLIPSLRIVRHVPAGEGTMNHGNRNL